MLPEARERAALLTDVRTEARLDLTSADDFGVEATISFGCTRPGASTFLELNGATEVTDWEVLAGPSPDALAPAGKAHRRGFETTIPVSADAAFVAVRALAGTRELGRSEPVDVRVKIVRRSSSSSLAMLFDSAGWATFNASAALAKLPWSRIARICRR